MILDKLSMHTHTHTHTYTHNTSSWRLTEFVQTTTLFKPIAQMPLYVALEKQINC